MAIFQRLADFISKKNVYDEYFTNKKPESIISIGVARIGVSDDGIFKAYIPDFLYNPPYGFPRKVNMIELKILAKNSYIFSVIKTIRDEAALIPWKIRVKEEFQEDGEDHKEKIKEVTKFFNNPNGNNESFEHLTRQIVTSILEVDAGIFVKVFNPAGEFKQLFVRDGSTFLKNPDIYGYLGNREDFVSPIPFDVTRMGTRIGGTPSATQQELIKQYGLLYGQRAAYFQYGWTAGSLPVPFGKREIVYIMQNPRYDSIYGRSPLEVLKEITQTLVYGSEFNLDFYINSNMPEGVITLLGAEEEHITQFRDNFEGQFRYKDNLGADRKRFFKFPIVNTPVEFTHFQLNPKDMDVLAQQEWFTKIVWMCFGITADEMGFTENSNKAVSEKQETVSRRKAIKPILDVIEYHLNTQIMPEFFSDGKEMKDFADIPLEIVFEHYEFKEDQNKHTILEQEIRMGVKTPMMAAVELGINIEELKKAKEEEKPEIEEEENDINNDKEDINKNPKENPKMEKPKNNKDKNQKSKSINPLKEIEAHIDSIRDSVISELDKLEEKDL